MKPIDIRAGINRRAMQSADTASFRPTGPINADRVDAAGPQGQASNVVYLFSPKTLPKRPRRTRKDP